MTSGPIANSSGLVINVASRTALWPIVLWAKDDTVLVSCSECGDGLIMTGANGRPIVITELAAKVETHIERFHNPRTAQTG